MNQTSISLSFLEFAFYDKELLTNTFEYLHYARHCFKCFLCINYFVVILGNKYYYYHSLTVEETEAQRD